MVTRITAGAFLTCGDKVLLMKRGLHKELGPGMWAGAGGHLDICDIKNPRAIDLAETCYREVYEETGIPSTDISNLKLKYIAVRKYGNEVRLHYYYFGEVTSEIPLPQCNEGEFFWIQKKDVPSLPMSTSVKEAIMHWLNHPESDAVHLVAVSPAGDYATISEV